MVLLLEGRDKEPPFITVINEAMLTEEFLDSLDYNIEILIRYYNFEYQRYNPKTKSWNKIY